MRKFSQIWFWKFGENLLFYRKKSLGGGTILDIGVYAIQASLWAFRDAPTTIKATGSLNSEGVDVEVNGVLAFKNGGIAKIHTSAKKELSNTAVIKGTKGTITVRNIILDHFTE